VIVFGEDDHPPGWIEKLLRAAFSLRRTLCLKSNAYRLINAEGDFFPGLLADVYNRTIVVRPLIRGVERVLPEVNSALNILFPHNAIFLKRDEKASRVEKLALPGGYVSGSGEGKEIIEENGLRFYVDFREGQKTGFYLDQRENRELLSPLANGKRVLNLFSYSGAFALYALKGGAARVDSVDTSAAALALAKESLTLNGFEENEKAQWIREDAFTFLDLCGLYDLIVLDPPPFARTRGEVQGALRGYRRLNGAALKRLSPNGILFTFSCSGAVDSGMFKDVLFAAGLEAGKRIQIIKELHAAADHPYSLSHLEGEYLKGFIVHVQ
jgi:23S rRNA (cytosine1962-C5)-methyltransferase